MDLNDKIKKQDIIIEELNIHVNSLISESFVLDTISAIRNPLFFLTKKTIGTLIGKTVEEIEDITREMKLKSTKKDIIKITKDLAKLEDLLGELQTIKTENLEFDKIWIEFKEKVSIDIENFKPGFKRDMEGTMNFSIVGVDNENKYMELKHDSFGKKSIIKLYFNTLDTYVDQQGDISLIYSKYADPDMEPVEGKEKKSFYRITKKQ